ncbi:MAG: T9SS type A sorting domain-containing protein [Candidatus Cloacimonetes bacterium]|nr:T9SS type A sorting domain-containing protein [Candidatus Cloacimonadota bacterium]
MMNRNLLFFIIIVMISYFTANASGEITNGYYLVPSPEVEVSGRVVGSDAPAFGIAGVEVVFTGNGTHTGITNDEGYFLIDTINSNCIYLITIEEEGYQDFVGEAIIGDYNVDLGDLVLLEYVCPANNVTAILNEYETKAEISWHSPEQGDLVYYNLYRLLWGEEENEETWFDIAYGLTDTFYIDLSWETVDWGVYRYAVKTVNTNNILSEAAFSNWLARDMYATVEMSFSTNIGDIPVGALVTLNSTEPDPDGNYPVYEAVTDEEGECTILDVWKSNYDITAEFYGYVILEDNIDIYEDTVIFEGMFFEELFPPYNVIVHENHSGNAFLVWHSPEAGPLLGYNLFRGLADDQASYEDWDLIVEHVQDTIYEDITWQQVSEPGEYMYCVRGYYAGETLSPPAFSNIICFDISAPVTIFISSNSGDSTDGAEVNLYNQDGVHNFNAIAEDGMVYWEDVFYGVYDLEIILPGHEIYLETDIWVIGCLVLEVEMEELLNPPVNLQYDPGSWILSWDAPEASRHIEYYNIYLDGEVEGQTTDLMFDLSLLIMPGNEYIVGVSTYYSSTQESEIIEIEIPNMAEDEDFINPHQDGFTDIYPNPFNPETNISFELVADEIVLIEVYNIKGQKVATVQEQEMAAGAHSVVWNAEGQNSGIFFLRFEADGVCDVKKVILLK